MFEKPRLYPIRDIGSPLCSLGNFFLALGVCLLVVGLRFYPIATLERGAPEQETTARVLAEHRIAEKMAPAASLVENPLIAPRQKLVVGEAPSPAAPQRPTITATSEGGVESPAPQATRLVIPALGVDAPVVEVPITNKTWDVSVLTYEIAHLGGTANPGEKNNIVLAGHVTLKRGAGPFLHLESLEPGDIAIVYAGEQPYTYRVVSKKYLAPTDVSVAFPTSDPILTLLTCTDWDAANRRYTQRVAVIAELVEEEAP